MTSSSDPDGKNTRVLIIEDEPGDAALLRSILKGRFGADVMVAASLEEARDLGDLSSFDVVTLDHKLSDGLGLELLEELAAAGEHPPVIMITGHGSEQTAARCLQGGACAYVTKDPHIAENLAVAFNKALAEIEVRRLEREKRKAEAELRDYREDLERLIEERTLELERANRRMREGRETLLAFLNATTDSAMLQDTEGRILALNEICARRLGKRASDLVGVNADGYLPPHTARSRRAKVEEVIRRKEPVRFEDSRDGMVFDHKVCPVFDEEGNVSRVAIFSRDITSMKNVEAAMKRREELYRALLETTTDVVFSLALDGEILSVVGPTPQISGYGIEDLVASQGLDFVIPDDRKRLEEKLEEVLTEGRVKNVEFSWLARDGSIRSGEINAVLIRSLEGEPLAISGTVRDITERKKFEQELLQLNRELESYARTVSHDLRAPLTSIRLAGQTLQRVWSRRAQVDDLDSEIARFGEVIELSSMQAEKLIGDLLDLALAGQEPEEISQVRVRHVLERIMAERSDAIRQKGVDIEIDDDMGTVRANPTHVYQLFGNLIDNAITHNDNPNPALEVRYRGSEYGSHEYAIRDNGPGLDPEVIEAFFASPARDESRKTGIGLAIVKKVLNLYDGSISFDSRGGLLCQFSLHDLEPAD